MDLHIKDGESAEAYAMRICSLKEALGKKWDEITSIINEELGQNYTESKYRKQFSAAKKYGVAQDGWAAPSVSLGEGKVVDTEALDTMTKATADLIMERQKLAAEKLEMQRQLRTQSRFELFYEKIADKVETLPLPKFEPIYYSDTPREYVLTVSDIHYGSTFDSENNSYSREIAKERLEKLCGNVIEFIQQRELTHLYVLSLGDAIQGMIHLSDIKLNDIPVVDCVVEIARLMAQFLNEISAYCYVDYYAVSAANHSQTRPLGSKANEMATEDLERIIISYVSDMLTMNERVSVHTDLSRDYITFKIFDSDCLALHGHQVRNVNTAIKDYSALHQTFYSYLFMGHLHAAQEIVVGEKDGHNCEVLISPALVGSCQYSDKILKGAKAAAKIYEFDELSGHVGTQTFILN